MKIFFTILFMSCILIFSSCKDDLVEPQAPYNLYGSWVFNSQQDSVTIMQRSFKLTPDKYGFTVYSNGDFLERKNSGWCGTPPIIYADYPGKWTYKNNNNIKIDVGYWGGQTSYSMQIISLSNDQLSFVAK